MTFDPNAHPRDTTGQFAEKVGAAAEVSLTVSDAETHPREFALGVTEDETTGIGWRNLRGTDAAPEDETVFAFQTPDNIAVIAKRGEDDALHILIADRDTVDTRQVTAQGVISTDDLGPHGEKAERALRDHLKFVPEYRNSREWMADEILPGDMVDMAPVLERLRDRGIDVDEASFITAESELFVIEDIQREDENTVVLYSDSGNWAVPVEELIHVEYHDPSYREHSEYAQPRHPLEQ